MPILNDLLSSGASAILAVAGAVLAVFLLMVAAWKAGKGKRMRP